MRHTPEPWRIGLCGVDAETNPIENDNGMVHITEAHPDDARRIVACVNACAGASTEDLEAHGFLAMRTRQVAGLEAQRDDLLAALKSVMDMVARGVPDFDTVVKGRAAIAKVGAGGTAIEGHNAKVT